MIGEHGDVPAMHAMSAAEYTIARVILYSQDRYMKNNVMPQSHAENLESVAC